MHIAIEVRIDGDQIAGHAGDGTSEPRPFLGWLGLIGVLDRLIDDARLGGTSLPGSAAAIDTAGGLADTERGDGR